jgi:hypothetical protein
MVIEDIPFNVNGSEKSLMISSPPKKSPPEARTTDLHPTVNDVMFFFRSDLTERIETRFQMRSVNVSMRMAWSQ